MLEWNVYVEDVNRREIKKYNVFAHRGFLSDCKKSAQKNKDKADFADEVKRSLTYYYWSKCEWEIILSSWPPAHNFREKKIDVYDQIMMNWDHFIDYLWGNREDLKRMKI